MDLVAKPQFSIITPTYTGANFLPSCLEALRRAADGYKYEVIIVIDGPNEVLTSIVMEQAEIFSQANIVCKVHQFDKNKGRFTARLKGAEMAASDTLLFVDDRVTVDSRFIREILRNKKTTVPNVLETAHKNSISRTLYLLRKKIYGRKWGSEFKEYDITLENFDATPKGTTALLVDRESFICAAKNMQEQYENANMAYSNDDTKLLRILIEMTGPIRKSSKAKIYYNPRPSFRAEAIHLYQRGPAFVDYYFSPSKKYFLPILLSIIVPFLWAALCIVIPQMLLVSAIVYACVLLLLSLFLSSTRKDFIHVLRAAPVVTTLFWLGLMKGVGININNALGKKILSYSLLLLFLCLLVVYVQNNATSFAPLRDVGVFSIAAIAVLHLMSIFLNGLFVRYILVPYSKDIPVGESFFVSLISTMGNYFLPVGTGTGIKAVYLKKKFQLSYSDFVSTLSGNYIIVFLLNATVGLLALLALIDNAPTSQMVPLLLFFAAVLFSMGVLAFYGFPKIILRLLKHIPVTQKFTRMIGRVLEGWNNIVKDRRLLVRLIILTLASFLVSSLLTVIASSALGITLSLPVLALYTSLASMSILLNITPGSVGIRESIFILISATLALTVPEILSISIIVNGVMFFVLCISWILFQTPFFKQRVRSIQE